MEMESSGRSMPRVREPGLKKPRLAEEAEPDRRSSNGGIDRNRPFPQRVPVGGGGPLSSRFRANERERDVERQGREESVRSAYQQQHQELVGQYKTALAELTFNSKPIITNLTIIAGENLHAAKWIAATVCANILEVPSEQKLPSLYLLDSIVKNIGRDYIKYFAARLPEVFCKAYRQVDSSIHSGMRHLFGTWKGVFPSASLQIIEKELGFPPAVNSSSSSGTTSRPDSQSQRPPHSIHVNPKYLEARQRLQQPSRAKGISTENSGSTGSVEDGERSDRTATVSARPWTDLPVKVQKVQHPQRDQIKDPVRETNPSAGYGDYEFVSDLPRPSDMESGKPRERIAERGLEKPWHGAGNSPADSIISQRNGFDTPNPYGNCRPPKLAPTISKLQPAQNIPNRSSRGTSGSWKNSEEEEYMWEDMSSRLADDGGTDTSRKDGWIPDDAKKPMTSRRAKWSPLETEVLETRWNSLDSSSMLEKSSGGEDGVSLQRDGDSHLHLPPPRSRLEFESKINREAFTDSVSRGQAAFGHRTPSTWPLQERNPVEVLSHTGAASIISGQSENRPTPISGGLSVGLNSSLNRTGSRAPVGSSVGSGFSNFGSTGTFGHQSQPPLRPASPSAPLSMYQRPYSPSSSSSHQHLPSSSLADHDYIPAQSFPQPAQKSSQLATQLNNGPQAHDSAVSQTYIHPRNSQNLELPLSQPHQHSNSSLPSLLPYSQLRHLLPSSSQQAQSEVSQHTRSQLSGEVQKPPSFPVPQMLENLGSGNSNNAAVDIPEQPSTSSLLAAIVNSGLVTSNTISSSFSTVSNSDSLMPLNMIIQPPLPSGPPPAQLTTSSIPIVSTSSALDSISDGNVTAVATQAPRTILPPLPPGPPPPSSLVGTSAQTSNTASGITNPFSSLLSSLVAKGLISAPATESPSIGAPLVPMKHQNQITGLSTSVLMPLSSASAASVMPPSSSVNELAFSESTVRSSSTSQATVEEIKNLIGTEFKPEIIKELHPTVISSLFDDLSHQCMTCGFRLKLQEQLDRHMDWHASRKLELSTSVQMSRKWYPGWSDWVAGNITPPFVPVPTIVEGIGEIAEKSEPLVRADESQSICALCGELFEDFYSLERDEWMYKGAVYMNTPKGEADNGGQDKSTLQGPIVHANCVSRSSYDHWAVSEHDKIDRTDE